MTLPRRSVALLPLAALTVAAALLTPTGASAGPATPTLGTNSGAAAAAPAGPAAPVAPAMPALDVEVVVDGLSLPWDVAFAGQHMLWTERASRKLSVRMPDGEIRALFTAPTNMWSSGETGLMALTVDPDFDTNRWVYTCHGWNDGSSRDIRVVRWSVNEAWTAASENATILSGIQITSGRHGGCRLRFDGEGALWVGTGDSAVGTNPRDLGSLNGKTLRIDREGNPWPDNPFIADPNLKTQKIFTYGHRNVQGLALRKDGRMWSAEHGSYRDDEVNLLKAGGDYGWHPVPGYDESVPMTDHDLPGKQIDARWSSGNPTIATSGMTFLKGKGWGEWNGRLAVAALAGAEMRLLDLSKKGKLKGQLSIPELDGDFGRLRTAQMGPGNALYVTTSNSSGNDSILKITPQG